MTKYRRNVVEVPSPNIKVEQEIRKLLPDKLALTIDGWRENSNHWMITLLVSSGESSGVHEVLI